MKSKNSQSERPEPDLSKFIPGILLIDETLVFARILVSDSEFIVHKPCKIISSKRVEEREGKVVEISSMHFAPWLPFTDENTFVINGSKVTTVAPPTVKMFTAYLNSAETIFSCSDEDEPRKDIIRNETDAIIMDASFSSSRIN